jgi:hypothetical protein
MQRDATRWHPHPLSDPFHSLQDRLGADHGWRELAQGTWEMASAWADSRPLFAPDWIWRDDDDVVLIPLAPGLPTAPYSPVFTLARIPHYKEPQP